MDRHYFPLAPTTYWVPAVNPNPFWEFVLTGLGAEMPMQQLLGTRGVQP